MTDARRRVVVTGMGAICALGDRPRAVYDALCEGQSRFAAPTLFAGDVAPGHHVAEVRDFDPEQYVGTGNVRPLDRTGRLALVGVELALADSGWTTEQRATRTVGLIVGTMFCSVRTIGEFDRRAQQAGPEYASPLDFSNTVLNAAAGQVAIWQKLRGVNTTIAAGATSGLHAIGYAARLIRSNRADALVAGGVEEVCYESFYGFYRAGRLAPPRGDAPGPVAPFDVARTGTAMGEGAAFLVLEAEETARARGAQILARVAGFGNAFDPDTRQPLPRRSVLAGVIAHALADAGASAGDIGAVVSSASGSPSLDALEGAGISTALGAGVPVTAIKSMTGETLGASGALQAMAAVEGLRGGRLPGVAGLTRVDPTLLLAASAETRPLRATRALVTTIAPEGNCCAVVMEVD
jgi:3-oxoacyl-[acyl-carrier-protein] synthase II